MSWLDCAVDVSHWSNGGAPIDWSTVDPSILLVFAKASQGTDSHDRAFAANRAGCAATGRLFIPYHFVDGSDADGQIANFEKFLLPGQPFALDWEGRANQTAAAEDVEYMGLQIADDIGWAMPVGYWGIPGSSPGIPTPAMQAWMRWAPRYPMQGIHSFNDMPEYWKASMSSYKLWQYTSQGRVSGLAGDVDRSVWNGTADELRVWYAGPAPQAAT